MSETFKIAFFNVGQGNCTVIKYLTKPTSELRLQDQHIWIIDAGSSKLPSCGIIFPPNEKQKLKVLAKYIANWIGRTPQSISIILTHQDDDHKNMIDLIIDEYRVSPLEIKLRYFVGFKRQNDGTITFSDLSALGFTLPPEAIKIPIYYAIGFNLDGSCPDGPLERRKETYNPYRLPVVFLERKAPLQIYADTNRNSLVVKFTYEKNSILLTGDATRDTFEKDLNEKPENLRATILELSHHGAETYRSNSPSLFNYVRPTYCIVSAHLNSQYGHPTPRVVGVLQDYYRNNFQGKDNNDSKYHFFFSNVALDSLSIGKNQSSQEQKRYDERFASLALMMKKDLKPTDVTDNDWNESPHQEVRTLYVTNYPLFYTGSDGTIIFTLTKGKSDPEIAFYDYDSTSQDKRLKELKNYIEKKEIMTRLQGFLAANIDNYSPLAINIIENLDGSFLIFLKDNKASLSDIRVLNIRESGMKINDLNAEDITKLFSDFPQLARIYANQSQIQTSDKGLEEMSRLRFFSLK